MTTSTKNTSAISIGGKQAQIRCKDGGGIISATCKVSPPKDPKFTLKISRVEVVEIFSDYL